MFDIPNNIKNISIAICLFPWEIIEHNLYFSVKIVNKIIMKIPVQNQTVTWQQKKSNKIARISKCVKQLKVFSLLVSTR